MAMASSSGGDSSTASPISSSSSLSDSLQRLSVAEANVARACMLLAQLKPPSHTAGGVAQAADAARRNIHALHQQLQSVRARVLDEPELLEEEQQRRLHTIEKHEAYIQELHGHLRTSVLQARAGLERAAVQARNDLLGTQDPATLIRRQKQLAGESASDKSAAFTASLHRTRSMLSDEISRSSSALDTLQQSTRVLGSTNSEYGTYGATVSVGRKVITKQLQRERTDKLLILVGLCFFTLVVVYIVNRRLAPFLFFWRSFFVTKPAAPVYTSPHATTSSSAIPAPATEPAPLPTIPNVHYFSPPVPLHDSHVHTPQTATPETTAAANTPTRPTSADTAPPQPPQQPPSSHQQQAPHVQTDIPPVHPPSHNAASVEPQAPQPHQAERLPPQPGAGQTWSMPVGGGMPGGLDGSPLAHMGVINDGHPAPAQHRPAQHAPHPPQAHGQAHDHVHPHPHAHPAGGLHAFDEAPLYGGFQHDHYHAGHEHGHAHDHVHAH